MNHHRQAKAYLTFMITYGYDFLTPSPAACLLYTQFLGNSLKNVRSKNYLSGARTYISSAGGATLNFDSPLITTLLKGISNLSDHIELQAPALTRPLLLRLIDGLRQRGPDGEVAAAACLFGVATFLRQSNFLPGGARGGPHLILKKDVTIGVAGMRVTVRTTKTLSPRSGGVVVPVAWVPGSPYCPVRSLVSAWGLGRGAPTGGLIFILPSTGRPLTVSTLTAAAREVLRGLTWPLADRFTVHSLRRTGARLAGAAGADESALMLHGTWSSTAVRTYAPRELCSTVPAAMASVLADKPPSC